MMIIMMMMMMIIMIRMVMMIIMMKFRFIILELLAGGDLKTFLRDSRSKPVRKFSSIYQNLKSCWFYPLCEVLGDNQ